jgi:hypothetical protein
MGLLRLASPTLLAAALAVAPAGAASAAAPAARAVVTGCERGLEPADRTGTFEGQMRRIAGTARMQMRFALQARTPDRARWSTVSAPGFGTWLGSSPGTARYVYTKRVGNLLAPAAYRVTVHFRWLDAAGAVLATAHQSSPACRQPDPRPDLVVRSIGVEAAPSPARRRYVVLVRNTGRSHAAPTTLALSIGGEAQPDASVPDLAAGEGTLVTVTGPACAEGAELVAAADAGQIVDESDESDDVLTRACPGG